MRLLSLFLLITTTITHLMAESVTNDPPTPPAQLPIVQSANATPPPLPVPVDTRQPPMAPGSLDPAKHRELFSERSKIQQQILPMRQLASKDPELTQLREQLVKIQKAYQDKEEALLTAQPGYADLKRRLDALDQQLGIRSVGMGMMLDQYPPRRPQFSPNRPSHSPPNSTIDPNATKNF